MNNLKAKKKRKFTCVENFKYSLTDLLSQFGVIHLHGAPSPQNHKPGEGLFCGREVLGSSGVRKKTFKGKGLGFSLVPGGGDMKDPGNKVAFKLTCLLTKESSLWWENVLMKYVSSRCIPKFRREFVREWHRNQATEESTHIPIVNLRPCNVVKCMHVGILGN